MIHVATLLRLLSYTDWTFELYPDGTIEVEGSVFIRPSDGGRVLIESAQARFKARVKVGDAVLVSVGLAFRSTPGHPSFVLPDSKA